MAWATFNVNAGMIVAGVLLVGGGVIVLAAADDSRLHTIGIGVVLLSGVIYLGARIWMLYRSFRR